MCTAPPLMPLMFCGRFAHSAQIADAALTFVNGALATMHGYRFDASLAARLVASAFASREVMAGVAEATARRLGMPLPGAGLGEVPCRCVS